MGYIISTVQFLQIAHYVWCSKCISVKQADSEAKMAALEEKLEEVRVSDMQE